MKFVFTCLFYSGWIGSDTNRFGFNSVRVISGSDLHRVNKSSSQFGFDSGHIGFRVNSGHYSFGPVRFWVDLISDFESKSVQLFLISVQVWFRVVRFGSLLPSLYVANMHISVRTANMDQNMGNGS